MHGDLNQEQRERAMAAFKAGKKDILIATDVAARGIDVDDVTHVINHTIPDDEKTYLHRAGRTGRAGKTGIAVTFVDWEDLHKWALINRALEFGQPEPTETYSSSPHLFSDLDIPAGSKGRLKPTPAVKTESRRRGGTPLGGQRRRRGPASSEGRPQPQPQPHPRRTPGGLRPPARPRRRGDASQAAGHPRRRRSRAPRRQQRTAPPSAPLARWRPHRARQLTHAVARQRARPARGRRLAACSPVDQYQL